MTEIGRVIAELREVANSTDTNNGMARWLGHLADRLEKATDRGELIKRACANRNVVGCAEDAGGSPESLAEVVIDALKI